MTRPLSLAAPAASLAVLAALLSGCSGSDDGPAPDAASPTSAGSDAPGAAPLATKATIRRVTGGRLGPAARDHLRAKITATVDAWFDDAYLDGDYPRTDFSGAFAVFTDGARERAEQDRRLMSNVAVGTTTYSVRALARRVKIDALAVGGRASAVTVQFRLGMARSGESGNELDERVSGHLYLTFQAGDGWRVFGYDVQRGQI